MRFHSTPESALNLEITKLAIIETIAAIALYVGIGVYFETVAHLALAVVVAPFTLLRTETSAEWGLRVFTRTLELLLPKPDIIRHLVFFLFLPVLGIAIRVVATVYWAVRIPIKTLSEMPQNWLRQSFCTDFFHPPEILPLEASKGDQMQVLTFAQITGAIFGDSLRLGFIVALAASPILLIGYLPSLIYRVTFKATALAYVPLIWVAHVTLQNPLSLKIRLERFTKGELEKVRRWFSWIIVTTLAAKLALVYGWINRSYIESKFPSEKIVESLVVPDSWPWWQMTLGADALLTFFLLYFADAALARLGSQQTWREEIVVNAVSGISFLRAVFGLATISHFFYLALGEADVGALLHRFTA